MRGPLCTRASSTTTARHSPNPNPNPNPNPDPDPNPNPNPNPNPGAPGDTRPVKETGAQPIGTAEPIATRVLNAVARP